MSGFLFILVVAVLAWLLLQERRKKMDRLRRLAAQGIAVNAEVIRRFHRPRPKSRKVPYIEYRFTTVNGETFQQKAQVTGAQYQQLTPGTSVDVVYDADNPDTSRLRSYLADKGLL